MEIAGNDALQKGIEVERRGLGTPATRACIIENLISKDFIEFAWFIWEVGYAGITQLKWNL
jgi:DNA topoisomerase